MALYIHGPLRCKNLLGRIPNPHSRPALAAPQHTPGPRSDARSQRTPPGEIIPRSAERPAHHHAHDQTARRHPGHTQHTPTRLRSDTQPPTLEAVQRPQPHTISPQTARKPARLSSRTGFFFCMMEPSAAQRTRSERTTQPDRRPHCPLHPYSAGEISHRSGKERTTSTTTAPHPTRAGPHWKPTADPAGSSSNHAHDQTAPHQQADRPTLPRPCYGKTSGGHLPARAATTPRPPANLAA